MMSKTRALSAASAIVAMLIALGMPAGATTGHGPGHGRGPEVTGPAKHGLCIAFAHGSTTKRHSTAFKALLAAAEMAETPRTGAAAVTAFCATPPAPTTARSAKPTTHNHAMSPSGSSGSDRGAVAAASTSAAVGGTDTTNADTHSNGHSALGSGNSAAAPGHRK